MNSNINFSSIKDGLSHAAQIVFEEGGEFCGRSIVFLKSTTEKVLPYLEQNTYAAVGALFVVDLILIEIGMLFSQLAAHFISEEHSVLRDVTQVVIGLCTVAGGAVAFASYTNLRLNWVAITLTTIVAVLFRGFFAS